MPSKNSNQEKEVLISNYDSTDDSSIDSNDFEEENTNFYLLRKQNLSVSNTESKLDISVWKIIQINRPEWAYLAMGVLGAAIHGISMSFYAIVFGETMGLLEEPFEEDVYHLNNILALVNISEKSICSFLPPNR